MRQTPFGVWNSETACYYWSPLCSSNEADAFWRLEFSLKAASAKMGVGAPMRQTPFGVWNSALGAIHPDESYRSNEADAFWRLELDCSNENPSAFRRLPKVFHQFPQRIPASVSQDENQRGENAEFMRTRHT